MPTTIYLLILAVLQGATEFLPISSSAHLIVLPLMGGWPDQGVLMDVSVHLGTLLAVLIYFRRDVCLLAKAALAFLGLATVSSQARILFWSLVIATVPVIALGIVFTLAGWEEVVRRVDVIAATSIAFGLLLHWADHAGEKTRELESVTLKSALLIGCAQMLSLIPGTSRAGVTMTAALALGFKRTEAARFSMLLSIPTILAAGGWSTVQLAVHGVPGAVSDALYAGTIAFVVAMGSIHFLLRWLERASMTVFVVYRVIFGLVLIVWIVSGTGS